MEVVAHEHCGSKHFVVRVPVGSNADNKWAVMAYDKVMSHKDQRKYWIVIKGN